jgi:hypothetical protein
MMRNELIVLSTRKIGNFLPGMGIEGGSVCLSICAYVCLSLCVFVCAYCLYVFACIYIYTYIYVCIYIYIHIYVCVPVLCICVCVCAQVLFSLLHNLTDSTSSCMYSEPSRLQRLINIYGSQQQHLRLPQLQDKFLAALLLDAYA